MKTILGILAFVNLLWTTGVLAIEQPTASNFRATQRPNVRSVDIDYDVSGSTSPVFISMEISLDGGRTWSVPTIDVSGAVGNNVKPGKNLRITWMGKLTNMTKFRIKALPVPTGMSLIPAGEFQMGDSLDGIGDAPVHMVTVSAFYLSQNKVTKGEWDRVRTWGLSNGYSDIGTGGGKAENHPVQLISWWDVIKWCNARSQKEGLKPCYMVNGEVMKTGSVVPNCDWSVNGYRLPTEAEWEKGARGGLTGKRFPWGDTISQGQANYNSSTSSDSYDAGPNGFNATGCIGGPGTSPVGSFPANGYWLYDMAGNVWDWCWDLYEIYPSQTQTDPRGASSGSLRVHRGGGWPHGAAPCRTADRGYHHPDYNGSNSLGFRVARSIAP